MPQPRKPKLLIVVLFHNLNDRPPHYFKIWSPPVTGMLVAAMTPPVVDVALLHEMVRPIDWSTDADFIALSFWDFHSPHAFQVARRLRSMGKTVVAGGRYPTSHPDDCQPHFDSVVVGEAHHVWPQAVRDMVAGSLKPRYTEPAGEPLHGIPAPRYDLAERGFVFPVATEASRGCRFACNFCQLTANEERFRKLRLRPIGDVLSDLKATTSLPFYGRKIANFVDNNIASDPAYAKELLHDVAKTNYWASLTQFTIDSARDPDFLDALENARCAMAFIGLESLDVATLARVNKRQNSPAEFDDLLHKLKHRGIVSFCSLVLGLDGEPPANYPELAAKLEKSNVDVLLLSLAVPIPGTPWAREVAEQGRIIDTDLAHYEGTHLVVQPLGVPPLRVLMTFVEILDEFYSGRKIARRFVRFLRAQLGRGLAPSRLLHTAVACLTFLHLTFLYRSDVRQRALPIVREQINALNAR